MAISEHVPQSIYDQYAAVYDRTGQFRFAVMMHIYLQDVVRDFAPSGKRMLDLACGTGTLALMQAERGWDVTGLDRSPAMLRQAISKQAAADVPATFVAGDVRDFSVETPFDLVTCFYDSLNYLLEADEMLACFRSVQQALTPDGIFCFDLATEHFLRVYWQGQERYADPSYEQVTDSSFDAATLLSTLVLHGTLQDSQGNTRQFEEVHVERAYLVAQIDALLEQAGLERVALYDCFTMQPPNDQSLRHFWIARRKREQTTVSSGTSPIILP